MLGFESTYAVTNEAQYISWSLMSDCSEMMAFSQALFRPSCLLIPGNTLSSNKPTTKE